MHIPIIDRESATVNLTFELCTSVLRATHRVIKVNRCAKLWSERVSIVFHEKIEHLSYLVDRSIILTKHPQRKRKEERFKEGNALSDIKLFWAIFTIVHFFKRSCFIPSLQLNIILYYTFFFENNIHTKPKHGCV